jgi:hypothetical protein
MDSNLYALEKQVESKLQEARAAGARAALCSSIRGESRWLWKLAASLMAIRSNRRFPRRVSAGASRI